MSFSYANPTKTWPSIPTVTEAKTITVANYGNLKPHVAARQPQHVLACMGHPGYGREYAEQVLIKAAMFGLTPHEAIYGGRDADYIIAATKGDL